MTGAEDLMLEGGTAAVIIMMIWDIRRKLDRVCRRLDNHTQRLNRHRRWLIKLQK